MLKAQTPRRLRCGLAAILLILTGCGDNTTRTGAANDSATNANPEKAKSAAPLPGETEVSESDSQPAATPDVAASATPAVDLAGLKALIAEHRGKVVYLDFWATWCAPCIKELPELAALQEKYGNRGLQVIAISFDEPDIWQKKAIPALKKAGWNGPSLIMQDADAQEAVVDWLGEDWRSELPARFLLDRTGEKAYEITLFSKDKLPPTEEMIEELLKRGE